MEYKVGDKIMLKKDIAQKQDIYGLIMTVKDFYPISKVYSVEENSFHWLESTIDHEATAELGQYYTPKKKRITYKAWELEEGKIYRKIDDQYNRYKTENKKLYLYIPHADWCDVVAEYNELVEWDFIEVIQKPTLKSTLTEAERAILSNLDKKWVTIARDEDGKLFVYDDLEAPFKDMDYGL